MFIKKNTYNNILDQLAALAIENAKTINASDAATLRARNMYDVNVRLAGESAELISANSGLAEKVRELDGAKAFLKDVVNQLTESRAAAQREIDELQRDLEASHTARGILEIKALLNSEVGKRPNHAALTMLDELVDQLNRRQVKIGCPCVNAKCEARDTAEIIKMLRDSLA